MGCICVFPLGVSWVQHQAWGQQQGKRVGMGRAWPCLSRGSPWAPPWGRFACRAAWERVPEALPFASSNRILRTLWALGMTIDAHTFKVTFGDALSPVAPGTKPPGSHFASSPFKHKLYCKRASRVSISLDPRLLWTDDTFKCCSSKYS